MYSIDKNGITKKLETWQVIIPLHDNEGKYFEKSLIDEILDNISLTFPGYTIVSCMGFWKNQKQTYKDDNIQILIDALPSLNADSSAFFQNLKTDLCNSLGQEKIYITKTGSKVEFISFCEFFEEIGLEKKTSEDPEDDKRLAEQLIGRQDFVMQRLSYETMVLQRIPEKRVIIWERKICGIIIRSELEDNFAEDAIFCAADQFDILGDALLERNNEVIIIGDYEYQKYALEKISYRALVEANTKNINNELGFRDQLGNPLSTKKFIELFSMSVFTNYMILREENYRAEEIKINIGSDGSLQIGESKIRGNHIMRCPATIPYKEVQVEIGRCIDTALSLYERNQLDPIAILQSKARNFYIKKRAIMRKNIKSVQNK